MKVYQENKGSVNGSIEISLCQVNVGVLKRFRERQKA